MIYLIGTAVDMKHEMHERPLADLTRIKLIRTEMDLRGVILSKEDEIIWGIHAPVGWARADIEGALNVAREKGEYECQSNN
jgi:hypothetical protein